MPARYDDDDDIYTHIYLHMYSSINIEDTFCHYNFIRILMELYRQNVSLLFNQTCLNEGLLPNYTTIYIYIYIYIYI